MTSTKTDTPAEARPAGAPWLPADVCAYLAVSHRTFRRMVKAGRIKTIVVGGKVMVPDAEVKRVAEGGSGEAVSAASQNPRGEDGRYRPAGAK